MTPAFRQYMEEQQNPDVSFGLILGQTVRKGFIDMLETSILVTRLVLHQILQTTDDYRLDDYDLYLGSVAVHPLASPARIQAKGIFGNSENFILGQSKMVPRA